MKYFKDELWTKFNSDISKEEYTNATEEWEKNSHEYSLIFERVKQKLSQKFLKIYLSNYGFHDYRLVKFNIIHQKYGVLNPISLSIIITDGDNIWEIKYKNIRKVNVNFENGNDEFNKRRGFDDWGYDEFLEVNENTLSYEILFASGANILIHFKNNNIFINKIDGIEQEQGDCHYE